MIVNVTVEGSLERYAGRRAVQLQHDRLGSLGLTVVEDAQLEHLGVLARTERQRVPDDPEVLAPRGGAGRDRVGHLHGPYLFGEDAYWHLDHPAFSRTRDDATPKIASSLLIHTAREVSQLLRNATSPSKVSACTLPHSSLSVVSGQIAQLVSAEERITSAAAGISAIIASTAGRSWAHRPSPRA